MSFLDKKIKVAEIILEVLKDFQTKEKIFSIYDVTKEARSKTSLNVQHDYVRSIVHQEFFNDNFLDSYSAQSIIFNIKDNPYVLVFYPKNKNPYDHPLAEKIINEEIEMEDRDICEITLEGRINIPTNVIKKVNPVGKLYCFEFNGKNIYRSKNKDGRLRVSNSYFGDGKKFYISIENNKMVLEKIC